MTSKQQHRWFHLTLIAVLALGGILASTVRSIHPTPARAAPMSSGLPSGSFTLGNRQDGEIASMRTRTSRTYAENGHYSTLIYPGSVNYQDAQGAWQPIDNTLVASSRPGYTYKNKANRYTVDFPADLGSAPIHVETSAGWIEFSPVGATGAGAISGNADTFTMPGAKVALTPGNDVLKETVTLQGPASPSTFVYNLKLSPGLTARQNSAGGIDFVNAAGQTQFSFAPPFVYDSSGPGSSSTTAVSMKLAQTVSGLTVTLSVDPTWLASSSRVWPVVIDPTVNFQPNPDCRIVSSAPSANYCTAANMAVGDNPSISRSLLKFNLGSLPNDAQILNAEFGLYAYSTLPSSTPIAANLYQVTQSWTSALTWNTYDGSHLWTTAGGDFSATAAATNNSVGGATGWYTWYPTQLVQGWVNGTIPNNGMILKEPTETSGVTVYFYTTNYQTVADWPYLKVSYQTRVGAQSFYALLGGDLKVNVANGNLMVGGTDLVMPGVGLPLVVDRTYNNLSPGRTDLGNGWVMGTGRDVGLTFSADGSATFNGPSGYQIPFIKNADGSFTSPTGIDATLVKNGDTTYTLTFHASGEQYNFSSGGFFTSDVDRFGNKLSFAYDGSNRLSSITDTQGHVTSFTYNASNQITQVTDPAGRTYAYGYDASNNLISYTDPASEVTKFAYDRSQNLTQITDPNGNLTKLAYDTSNRVTSITDAQSHVTSFAYNAGNTVVTDPNGHATTYTFDTTDRTTAVKDPAGNTGHASWTADSHVSQEVAPSGATTSYTFDANNNLTQATLPTNATVKAQYGNSSLPYYPTSVTDTVGNTTTLTYNSNGTLASATDATGSKASATYNGNGTVATETDPNGNVTSYSYNASGLLAQVTPPSPLGAASYTYNSYNLAATKTDGKGQTATYSYDLVGRVTGIAFKNADGTAGGSLGYAYDADGNVLSMTDATGTTSYTYDTLNELTKKTLPNSQTVSYAYDAAGNLLSKTDSGGTTSYTYTSSDQVATVTDRQGARTSLSYNSDGERTQMVFPDGVTQSMTYNGAGQLTKVTGSTSTTTLTSYSYSYTNPTTNQPTDLPYSVTDVAGKTTSYTYDAANELTQAVQKDGTGATLASYIYAYDAAGNTTSQNLNGASTTFTYNAANQLTQASGAINSTYTWDANGNLTSRSDGMSLVYNAQNQTTSVTPAGGSAISMTYTGPGQAQRVTAGSTSYQYDAAGMSMQTAGGSTTTYTTLPDGALVSETIPSGQYAGTYYYLGDGSGSVAALTNSSGAVVNQYSYDPNGNMTSSGSVPNPITYQSAIYDSSTGLYKMGGSYYDPRLGQLTQGFLMGQPAKDQGWCDPGEDAGPPGEDEADPTGLGPGGSPCGPIAHLRAPFDPGGIITATWGPPPPTRPPGGKCNERTLPRVGPIKGYSVGAVRAICSRESGGISDAAIRSTVLHPMQVRRYPKGLVYISFDAVLYIDSNGIVEDAFRLSSRARRYP